MEKDNKILAKDNNITLNQHIKDCIMILEKLNNNIPNLPEEIKNSIKISLFLHDIGKVLPYFQIVTLKNKNYEPFDISQLLNIYHSLVSILFINKEILKQKYEKDYSYILSAIAYHHWKDSLENDLRFGAEKFEYLLLKDDNFKNTLINNIKKELSNFNSEIDNDIIIFDQDITQGLANGLSLAEYIIPPYQLYWFPKRLETNEEEKKKCILISGFLQRCDHYASFCEKEEKWLKKKEEDKNIMLNNVEIKSIQEDKIINNIKAEISKKFNNISKIKLWQEDYLKNSNIKDSNLILIAPTGIGKTEFAFLWGGDKKFFYTLPLRAAVEQIYDRAIEIFTEKKTGLLHSDADVYLLGDNYNYEKIKVYNVAKQLSYPVIISTGDQFFPYGLRPPGYERIYATFSYSRLIIDEVQAYDPRAAAIIVKFIEDIVRLGGKFLLMTATFPEYIEKEIKNRISNNTFKIVNLYDNEKDKYKSLKKHKLKFEVIKNNKNDFSLSNEIIQQIIDKAKNKRVLIIMNTIKQAKDLYKKILEKSKENDNLKEENIILFHSQFTINEKNEIKKNLEEKFKNPKDEKDTEGKILIATQVIEAAINIDADILYTEICPMDALVQRMGRVLRRYMKNFVLPENSEPNIYILIFNNGYESGNGYVYDKELIEKTMFFLDNPDFEYEKVMDVGKLKKEIKKSKKNKQGGNTNEFNLEKLRNLKDENYTLVISEYQKYELVNKLYKSLDLNGKYLSSFYEMLLTLDAGFMSDRKEEAQRIFRKIVNASTIDETKREEFIEKIKSLVNSEDFNYTKFKKEIIADFIVPIPYYKLKAKTESVIMWIDSIKFENLSDEQKLRIKKLKEWCEDIFIINSNNIKDDN